MVKRHPYHNSHESAIDIAINIGESSKSMNYKRVLLQPQGLMDSVECFLDHPEEHQSIREQCYLTLRTVF